MKVITIVSLVSVMAATACLPCRRGPATPPPADLMVDFTAWITGAFSSHAQARDNEDYFDILLRMGRIWPARDDAFWLYVEQAVAQVESRPYRQRIYRIRQLGAEYIEVRIFTFPDPLSFVGEWRKEEPFAGLLPELLEEREGCTVLLVRKDESTFAGSTVDGMCTSDLNDAVYATTEVILTADRMLSWDRGYNAEGSQVWGPEAGPYIFNKLEDWEP
ncbi:chromophore lyase CpcT/CpeT [bacterium]|nr:chromophore lyase CpcT/CpeT [candidate division CSSED10-310 bacterium]